MNNWSINASIATYINIFAVPMLFVLSLLINNAQYRRSRGQQIKIFGLKAIAMFVIFLIKFCIVSHCSIVSLYKQLNNLFFSIYILFLLFYNFNNIFNNMSHVVQFFRFSCTTNFFENSKIIYRKSDPWNFCLR